jgi:cytochrome P450
MLPFSDSEKSLIVMCECYRIASVETTGTVLALILISIANPVSPIRNKGTYSKASGTSVVTINPFQQRLLDEVLHLGQSQSPRGADTSESDNSGKDGVPQYDFRSIDTLPYLDAAVKEGLRVFASSSVLERVVPPSKGFKIQGSEGWWIPPGTIVGAQSWSLHRKEEVWGVQDKGEQNSRIYIPDRWITDEPGKLEEMERHFMPFGRGTRQCAGKNMAIMVMKLAIVHLLNEFEIRVNTQGTGDGEMELRYTHFVSTFRF